jgi:hypothetical protein
MGKNQQDGSQIKITGWWLLFPSEKYDFVRQLGLLKKNKFPTVSGSHHPNVPVTTKQ